MAATLGGLAGSVATALGRPAAIEAAAGDNLKLGQTNYAGTSATRLNTTSSGGAFWMTQYGSGSGVRGDSVNGHGGVFTTAHPDRQGLLAQQTGAGGSGAALRAEGGANTGVYGVSTNGRGVSGFSTNGRGVSGDSTTNAGVYGSSVDSYGVYGTSTNSYGVAGESPDYIGVFGYSTGSGYGVYGYSIGGDAGYFEGTCYATSFTGPAAPTVRLDHPLAPASKVLAHAAVVSDAPATLYSGTVTTDAAGEATVQLPEWFSALNTDLRYQLTPFADVRAWIKTEVADNRFTIATSEPGTKVSWLLSGVRADAYAAAHPFAVESKKVGRERGRYLTPTELGQPESTGVDWEARQQVKTEPLRAPAG